MLHTNVKHEPSTYTEAITERGAQCTRYGFAQKKRNLLQETAVGIIFTMGPKNFFEVQCNFDLVIPYLVKNLDLVTIQYFLPL